MAAAPPPPPPADVIVENTEFDPDAPTLGEPPDGDPAPPAPTVIGYVCCDNVIPVGFANGEFNGPGRL
jgi:hypothetical protein